MGKRLVDIDGHLLKKAKALLGASSTTETVNRALDEVVRIELRRRRLESLACLEGLDLDDPEVMAGAWHRSSDT